MLINISKIIILTTILLITSCVDNITSHGITLSEKNLAKINVGVSRKMIIREILGPASIESKRDNADIWYYISYKKSKRALKLPYYVSHDVIEMEFKNDKIVKLTKYDKTHLNQISYNQNKTRGREGKKNIFKQLLGNIGRFDGESDL